MDFDIDNLNLEVLWAEFVEHTGRWLRNYYCEYYIYDPERKTYV